VNITPGWLTDAEAECLARLAAGKNVLELGAWLGRSTVTLASTAEHVVSVDWHKGDESAGFGDTLPGYWDAVRNLDNVTMVVGRFEFVLPLFAPRFALTFVDGAHDHDSVVRDACLAVAVTHGKVVFHDFNQQRVQQAIEKTGIVAVPLVDSLAVWETT
jgi:predicted O-methyltransferase YrrM